MLEPNIMFSDRAEIRYESTELASFHRLLGIKFSLLAFLIDKFVKPTAITEVSAKGVGFANIFHGVLAVLEARFIPNVDKLRIMANNVDNDGISNEITLNELTEIHVG